MADLRIKLENAQALRGEPDAESVLYDLLLAVVGELELHERMLAAAGITVHREEVKDG